MKIKKLIALFMVITVMCVMMFSCADQTPQDTPNNTPEDIASEGTPADETEESPFGDIADSLPADLDFKGAELRVLHRLGHNGYYGDGDIFEIEVFSETETGDTINDAIYDRNRTVEDRLNIKITPVGIVDASWDRAFDFFNHIRRAVSAGDDEFDVILGYAALMPNYAMQGL
ncbi:MAG: hypothetical protein FWD23_10730, partial [Oscillospiraceae bacterium]|nr:hypothetical protein [Oscillospiraceae bacterium]